MKWSRPPGLVCRSGLVADRLQSGRSTLRAAPMALAAVVLALLAPGWTKGDEPRDERRPRSDQAGDPATVTTRESKEDKLIDKLIGGDKDNANDVMARLIDLMDEAGYRLTRRFDPGDDTQHVQDRIVKTLDEAIQQAASNRRRVRSAGAPSVRRPPKPSPSDKRQPAEASAQDASDAATHAVPGQTAVSGRLGGLLKELKRGWGMLPDRDRDEVVQGAGEDFLEKYREAVERYFKALAEPEERR